MTRIRGLVAGLASLCCGLAAVLRAEPLFRLKRVPAGMSAGSLQRRASRSAGYSFLATAQASFCGGPVRWINEHPEHPPPVASSPDGVAHDHHPIDEAAHPSEGVGRRGMLDVRGRQRRRLRRGRHAQAVAGRSVYLPHRLRPACRPDGADAAGRHAQADGLQADALRRHRRVQPAGLYRRLAFGRRWSNCAATSPVRHWPTNACRPTPPDRWCSGSRQPGATAPRTWSCRRWSSCSGWQRWCHGRGCT